MIQLLKPCSTVEALLLGMQNVKYCHISLPVQTVFRNSKSNRMKIDTQNEEQKGEEKKGQEESESAERQREEDSSQDQVGQGPFGAQFE